MADRFFYESDNGVNHSAEIPTLIRYRSHVNGMAAALFSRYVLTYRCLTLAGMSACITPGLHPMCMGVLHYTNLEGDDRLVKTTQENVRSQLDHLCTHPSVALLLRKKQVDLHGWVYSISTGDVWVYDFEIEQFTSLLDETYPRLKTSS
jgi:hypothetical protein